MVEIEVRYEGDLHTRSVHGPSGAELQTDAPVDNQGRGEAFSPTALVAGALGACLLTVMGIVADRHGWAMAGTRVRVEKHMVTEPLRRIGRLVVELTWAPGLPDSAHGPLTRAAETCPVRQSLDPAIEVDLKVA
ncbi:OsmC family protein [Myxococcota bacterium]|nr:OsmC family protein [Myxococcota bacterium]